LARCNAEEAAYKHAEVDMRTALLSILSLAIAVSIHAATIRGVVRDESGVALPGVTVYEKGASETAVTDGDGRFSLEVAALPATLTAFLGGFNSATLEAKSEAVEIKLEFAAVTDTVTVTAKAPRSAVTSTFDVRPLDVLRTPGAQADLFKALQTLPGVAKVDEGAGLFVRGGDVSEVRVMLDGAAIEHPFRHESPAGGQFGSIPPMLLEGIAFSTGGFSARYGNALSAILELRGLGKPSSSQTTVSAGLANVSARASVPVSESGGLRVSGNFSNTSLLFAVNGAPREFDRMPSSWDLNVSGHVESPALGTLKLFAMTQHDAVGVSFRRNGFDGFLHSRSDHSTGIVNWKKNGDVWLLTGALGADTYARGTDVGVVDLAVTDRRLTTRFEAMRVLRGAVLRLGTDTHQSNTSVTGVKALRGHDYNGAGGSVAFDVDSGDARGGVFAEIEKTYGKITPTIGVRADGDRLLGSLTVDPRVNVAFALTPGQKLRVAWGIFHQTPSPHYFDRVAGARTLRPMQAEHWIAGYEMGAADGPLFLRAEGYRKTYSDLPLEDPLRGFTSEGYGTARGLDLFASKKWARGDVRASYSLLSTRRRWTPYDQQQRFVLPDGTWRPDFDIPNVLSVVATMQATPMLGFGMALSSAAGKPMTPIVGAKPDTYGFSPVYGAINSERFPRYQRCDLSVTFRPRPTARTTLIYFAAISNVFARRNVSDYVYSADYSARAPVVSAAPRSFYAGFTLVR
jgi:vitamin B12 transporter